MTVLGLNIFGQIGVLSIRSMAIFALVAGSGCQMFSKSRVSVDYYQINGNSTAALDREIKRKGPVLGGGRHAVAVARISMIPNIKYRRTVGSCRVERAKIAVDAKVTLPAWQGRNSANAKLAKAWDNIDRYTRLHEAVHVAMAFRYAKQMETELLDLPVFATCAQAREAANAFVTRKLHEHDAAQKQFDADEAVRLERFAKRRRLIRS